MVSAVQGYGLVRLGEVAAGTAELAEAVAWFERSQLHYTRSLFALWLVEGRSPSASATGAGHPGFRAHHARENGYRHLEGVAERLLGEALGPEDPRPPQHLEAATDILQEIGAFNDIAKILVVRGTWRRAAGDTAGARTALERALAIFESLGTRGRSPGTRGRPWRRSPAARGRPWRAPRREGRPGYSPLAPPASARPRSWPQLPRDVPRRADRQRHDGERRRRRAGGHEAAAAHEIEVGDLVRSQVRVDHARPRIGPHSVGADLVGGERSRCSPGWRLRPWR